MCGSAANTEVVVTGGFEPAHFDNTSASRCLALDGFGRFLRVASGMPKYSAQCLRTSGNSHEFVHPITPSPSACAPHFLQLTPPVSAKSFMAEKRSSPPQSGQGCPLPLRVFGSSGVRAVSTSSQRPCAACFTSPLRLRCGRVPFGWPEFCAGGDEPAEFSGDVKECGVSLFGSVGCN